MQRPLPYEWLLSETRLRMFDPELIKQALGHLRSDNFQLTIVSRAVPGKWNKKEKWYGTEYTSGPIASEFLAEIQKAATSAAGDRIPKLHLPHRNQFIPTKFEVEKTEVNEPAPAPRIIRNDLVRTWYKKDDVFWVPKANVIVSCKSSIIFPSARNHVMATMFTYLVRDVLEEYSCNAKLAGLRYGLSLDSWGLFIGVSGYNDKLPWLLEQVLIAMRDLEIRDDRFDIIKERLTRAYLNWELQPPSHQIGEYLSWLAVEHDVVVEELAAELPTMELMTTHPKPSGAIPSTEDTSSTRRAFPSRVACTTEDHQPPFSPEQQAHCCFSPASEAYRTTPSTAPTARGGRAKKAGNS